MILCDDDFNFTFLNPILKSISDNDLELLFVDSKRMQEINKSTRNIDKSTDVLSFPLDNSFFNHNFLGSIVINLDLAKEKSAELKHSLEDEISLLFIHGLLHLLGFDHEKDNGQMRAKEEELIKEFNLPKSLIVRTLD